jgi:hypothetical protein
VTRSRLRRVLLVAALLTSLVAPAGAGATRVVTAKPVALLSPLPYTTYATWTMSVATARIQSSVGATCVLDWGDGYARTVVAIPAGAGTWICSATHTWTTRGFYCVSVTATAGEQLLGRDQVPVFVR